MSDSLTLDTIRAAQGNDLNATTDVIKATESRVMALANRAASRMRDGSRRALDHVEEFAQIGRVAVWESLSRFEGDSVDSFYGFVYATVERRLLDAVREERTPGADSDALKVFLSMLPLADNDGHLAEKMSQTVPPKGRRLSADRANAARLAWQGTDSLDAFTPGDPDEGTDSIADTLASALGIPEDLLTSADFTADESRRKHAIVNAILDLMGQGQRDVIRHSFGIGGVEDFGYGREDNRDAELAAFLGTAVGNLRPARTKGLKSFAKRYVKAVATSPEHAAELTEAAAKNVGRQP
jgi:RNA polymerase sigma factor (sigma-70 family)